LTPIDEKLYESVQKELAAQFDEKWGGFGFSELSDSRPKFPEPSNLLYLIDRVERSKDAEAKSMLVATLEKMEMGGIRDHLAAAFTAIAPTGSGGSRILKKCFTTTASSPRSTPKRIASPAREDFRRVCEELCDFILREMSDKSGGFYAALDADAEDEEGKFYRWEKAEVQKLLTKEEFELFSVIYGLTGEPNFEEKYYALQLAKPMLENAKALKMKESDLEGQLTPIRKKLLDARNMRPPTAHRYQGPDRGQRIDDRRPRRRRTHSQKRSLPCRRHESGRLRAREPADKRGPALADLQQGGRRRRQREAQRLSRRLRLPRRRPSSPSPRNRRQKVAHSRG